MLPVRLYLIWTLNPAVSSWQIINLYLIFLGFLEVTGAKDVHELNG